MYGMTDPLHSLELSRLHYLFTTFPGCIEVFFVVFHVLLGSFFFPMPTDLLHCQPRKHDKTNAVNRPRIVVREM